MYPIYFIIAIIINNVNTKITNNTYPELVEGPFCSGDRVVFLDCNVCQCYNGYYTDCTKYRCDYKQGQSRYLNCVTDEMKVDDNCYLCFCRHEYWQCSLKTICGDNVDNKNETMPNSRGLRQSLISFGDDDDNENGPPPCVRVNQFTFECNSSRVGSTKTLQEHRDNIP